MEWSPKQEVKEVEPLKGEFDAEIIDAVDTQSKQSNADMTTLVVEITQAGHNMGLKLYDHFVHGNAVARARMLQVFSAARMLDRERVTNEDLIGSEIRVKVGVRKFRGLPQGRVDAYIPRASSTSESKGSQTPEDDG